MKELSELFSLRGSTAIVTGASSGLGERAARVMHSAGATVVAVARRGDRLDSLAEDLGDRCVPVVADLTERGSSDVVIDAATHCSEPLRILVNVAGISDEETALREGTATFERVLAVNLVGVFDLSVRFATSLRESRTGGTIVNVASILGLGASPVAPGAGYAASKAGVVGLTMELASQWHRYGIRVNALAPGFFPTEMTGDLLNEGTISRAVIDDRTLMGRPGRAEELDGPLLLLASEASSYMTGQVVAVDGGWTAV
jgi:NAD(P)-dependent dehydrogenase (short-subunit alcohol dehydrogenase family)